MSGSGKSSLAFDTVLAECQRRFFIHICHYSRQFFDMGQRPKVNKIEGLSPAIALAQNETQASVRATVASLTDIGELLGVLLAKHSTKYCPHHDLPTEGKKTRCFTRRYSRQNIIEDVSFLYSIREAKKVL